MTTMVICPVFLSTSSPQESQGEAYSSSLSPKKKGKGGRKKNLHPPTPTIMKHRRNMANARERKRMNGLNDAFERLREVVPNVNTEQVCLQFFNRNTVFWTWFFAEDEQDRDSVGGADVHQGLGEADGLRGGRGGRRDGFEDQSSQLA